MSVHETKKLRYNMKNVVFIKVYIALNHSHKKRKDSLEGSLGQVLFAAEHEFPKILVPRLPQNLSNVNIECTGIYLYFIILMLICF